MRPPRRLIVPLFNLNPVFFFLSCRVRVVVLYTLCSACMSIAFNVNLLSFPFVYLALDAIDLDLEWILGYNMDARSLRVLLETKGTIWVII